MIEHIWSPASEAADKINWKNGEDYILGSPSNLKSPSTVSFDLSLSEVKGLRLSAMQRQMSWLGRIATPITMDNNDEMKPKKQEKQWNKHQIEAVLEEYLNQFVQKYDKLQRKYCNEKKVWTEKVEFLERQNSILKSELHNAERLLLNKKEELTNIKKFYSPNQSRVKGNLLCVTAFDEKRKTMDITLTKSKAKACLSFQPECTGKKGQLVDFKLGYCRQVNHVELERIVQLNENQICSEEFTNKKKKLDEVNKLNMEPEAQQEWLQSRNIFRKFSNKFISDDSENLKVDIAPFESSLINAQQEHHKTHITRNENCLFLKNNQLDPTQGTFGAKSSRDSRGCDCARITVQDGAITSAPCGIEESAGAKLSSVTQDLPKMNKKTIPKTVCTDPHVLAMSDSWYLQKKHGEAVILNSRSLKVDKKKRFVNYQKMCQVSRPKSVDSRSQYKMTNRRVNKSISGSPIIRSKWL